MKRIITYFLPVYILINFYSLLYSQVDKNNIQTINIGFASNLFPESDFRDAKAAIELWSRELKDDGYMAYYLAALIFKSNDEMKEAFLENKISIAAMHALDYLYIKKESGIIPLLIPSIKDDVTETYIILVNKKSNIKSIGQLKNKKVAIQSNDSSLISYVWFENVVMMNQSSLLNDFCNLYNMKKDSKAIFSVFFNQNDACVVNSRVYYEMCKQNHQLVHNLTIIESSEHFIRDIFCISKNLEKKYIGNLLDATISIQNYESGKKMMNLFQFEKFTIFEEQYIKNLEKLLKDNRAYHKKLKFSRKHK